MTRGALLGFLLLSAAQDEAERVRELVRALSDDSVEVRARAAREVPRLPARLLPLLEAEARTQAEPEVEAALARVRIPAAWGRVLRGTLGENRAAFDRISNPAHPDREAALRRALDDLGRIPAAELREALESLAAVPDDETRQFALRAMARVPPRDARILDPFLARAKTTGLAAEILIRMNDASIVPRAVDLFCEEGGGTLGAARVLEHFGAGDHGARIVRAMRDHPGLLTWGIRILARGGAAAEESLLEVASFAPPHRGIEVAAALAEVGGRRSLPAVRAALRQARPDARDWHLWLLRDPEWAVERLALTKARFGIAEEWPLDRLAQAGGPELREPLLGWLAEEGLAPAVEAELLALLGAVGGRGDATVLLRRMSCGAPLLEAAAGEGLDRLGDPSLAPRMFAAARRGGPPALLRALIPIARGVAEEEFVDALLQEDPPARFPEAALRMAASRLTPRVREALFRRTLEGWPQDRGVLAAEAAALLAPGLLPGEKPWIERLRAEAAPARRALGLFLAARSGDAEAGRDLEKLLAAGDLPAGFARALGGPRPVDPAVLDSVEQAIAEGLPVGDDAEDAFVAFAGADRWERLARRTDPERPAGRGLALLARAARPEGAGLYRRVVARRETDVHGVGQFVSGAGLCAAALARLGDREVARPLRLLLRSPVASARAQAAEALALLGDRGAVPALILLVDDPVPVSGFPPRASDPIVPVRRVWHAAMAALERLADRKAGGSSAADRRADWRAWAARR